MVRDMNPGSTKSTELKILKGKSKGNSKAVLSKRVDLDTTPAQKALEKDFNVLQGHLFRINYMSEIIANQNDTQEVVSKTNEAVAEVFEKAITHILKEQSRLDTLIDQNKLNEADMHHDNPVSYQVEISSPLAQKLILLYVQYDSLIKKSEFLYLNSLFEPKQAQNLQYEYKRVVERVGGRIRDLASKLHKAQQIATEESKKNDREKKGAASEVMEESKKNDREKKGAASEVTERITDSKESGEVIPAVSE